MIDHNVGVSSVSSYTLKKVDDDFFLEECFLGIAHDSPRACNRMP